MEITKKVLENGMTQLQVTLPAEDYEKAIREEYEAERYDIELPNYPKGQVPMKEAEKAFGPNFLNNSAATRLMSEHHGKAVEESGIQFVSKIRMNKVQAERGKPFIYTIEAMTKPELKVSNYIGVEVTEQDTEVTEEELRSAVEEIRQNYSRKELVTDRPVRVGDIAVIDFEGYIDGAAFEGGSGDHFSLEIGSHTFIGTFEEQLVGAQTGEKREVRVIFPENYPAEEIAGKPAVFDVTIDEIRQKDLLDYDDAFVQDISDFNTVAEYEKNLREEIHRNKMTQAQYKMRDEAVRKIAEASHLEVPPQMVDKEVETILEEFCKRLSQQGMTLKQNCELTGVTREDIVAQIRPQAELKAQAQLVIEAIAEKEGITVQPMEVEAELKVMAESYQMPIEKLKQFVSEDDRKGIEQSIVYEKVLQKVMENVKIVPKNE